MKVVITGATGLLGQEVSRALIARGDEVHVLRARVDGRGEAGFFPIDVSQFAQFLKAISPECVFHLAGISTARSIAEFSQVNTLYAATLLDALSMAGLDETCTVLVGTAAEYGPMAAVDLPAREDGPTRPCDYYGASKLAQTYLGLSAARKGRRVLVARPSNLVGPGMSKNLALGSFVAQLSAISRGQQEPVLRVGDLSGSRDLIDVRDAAEFIVRLAAASEALGKVVNVSTGRAVSMQSVVDTLLKLFEESGHGHVRIAVRNITATAASSKVHFSCNKRLAQLLNGVEFVPLEETLAHLLDVELSGCKPNS